MTLATQGVQGLWASAVFFVHQDFEFYFLSAKTTRHALNIASDSRVAATIQLDYERWQDIKGVQMEGLVVELSGLDKAHALALYTAKFPVVQGALQAPRALVQALARVSWYRFTPDRLYFIDNSKGFGHRDELDLSGC